MQTKLSSIQTKTPLDDSIVQELINSIIDQIKTKDSYTSLSEEEKSNIVTNMYSKIVGDYLALVSTLVYENPRYEDVKASLEESVDEEEQIQTLIGSAIVYPEFATMFTDSLTLTYAELCNTFHVTINPKYL